MVRVPAVLGGAPLDVVVELLRVGERLVRGEDRLGVAGGEVAPVLRRAGLHQQGVALRGARHVERASHPEVLAVVLRRIDLLLVTPHAAGLVGEHHVVVPGVPELERDVDELGGPLVALPVCRQVVQVEVAGGVEVRRGDDVPAGPATADDVERGEPPRQVVGLVVGGRRGGDQADPLGRPGERGEQHGRLEHPGRAAPDLVPEHRPVGEEERVELAPLGDAGQVLVVLDVDLGVRVALRQPPRGLVVPDTHQERVQVKLSRSAAHATASAGAPAVPFGGR
nr:hypothetical protein GCM10020092_066960 [Actinoplanes digitatis]